MRKQWTEYELAVVFYYVKFGNTFGIEKGITLSFNDMVDHVGHGEKSFWLYFNKMATCFGFNTNSNYEVYLASKSLKESIREFDKLTVSQMRNLLESLREEYRGYGDLKDIKIDTQYKLDFNEEE